MPDTLFSAAQLRELAARGIEAKLFRSESSRFWVNLVTKDHPDSIRAEMHDEEADIYLVLEGEGYLSLGGTLVQPTIPSPGQHRGVGLEGADVAPLKAGDLVVIPEGTPHMVDARANRLVYLVVKCVTTE